MPRFPQFISKKFKKKDFPISEVKTLQKINTLKYSGTRKI